VKSMCSSELLPGRAVHVGLGVGPQPVLPDNMELGTGAASCWGGSYITSSSNMCAMLDTPSGLQAESVTINCLQQHTRLQRWVIRCSVVLAHVLPLYMTHLPLHMTHAGATIPDTASIMQTVMHAHFVATPDVPLVGWDVALTPGQVSHSRAPPLLRQEHTIHFSALNEAQLALLAIVQHVCSLEHVSMKHPKACRYCNQSC